jgi:hypothetical protein
MHNACMHEDMAMILINPQVFPCVSLSPCSCLQSPYFSLCWLTWRLHRENLPAKGAGNTQDAADAEADTKIKQMLEALRQTLETCQVREDGAAGRGAEGGPRGGGDSKTDQEGAANAHHDVDSASVGDGPRLWVPPPGGVKSLWGLERPSESALLPGVCMVEREGGGERERGRERESTDAHQSASLLLLRIHVMIHDHMCMRVIVRVAVRRYHSVSMIE